MPGSIHDDNEGGNAVLTTPAADSNFMTGAVLSWALPIALLLVIVVWWAIVLTIRAFKPRQPGG